jgi:Helix-turn-helix
MLSPAKVEEVRRLLVRGNVSQRQIAKLLGVSRGSVNAIASGKRPDYPVRELDEDDIRCWLPPVRCNGCGGMVYAPCRLCRLRAEGQLKVRGKNQNDARFGVVQSPPTHQTGKRNPIKPDRCAAAADRAEAHQVADFPAVAPRVVGRPADAESRQALAGHRADGRFA